MSADRSFNKLEGFRDGTPEEIQRRKDAVCQAALEFQEALRREWDVVPDEIRDELLDLIVSLGALYRSVNVDVDAECMDS